MKAPYVFTLSVCVLSILPVSAMSATVVDNISGAYDISSDTLYTGIAHSESDGAGSYVIEFFKSGDVTLAVADAAVTDATVNSSFTNLTMSWIDGLNANTLVSSAGVDTLSTIFDATYPVQQLRFDWTDSVAQSGFRFDISTSVSQVPLPAGLLLLGSGGALLGLLGRRRRTGQTAA